MEIAIVVLVILAAGVLIAVCILYTVGLYLPRRHVAEGVIEVLAPPSKVAALVRDVPSQPRWRSSVTRIKPISSNGTVRYHEVGRNGRIQFALREIAPGSFEVFVDDSNQSFGGRWVISTSPSLQGTSVYIREEGYVHAPLFRALAKYVFGHETTLKTYLHELKVEAERKSAHMGERRSDANRAQRCDAVVP